MVTYIYIYQLPGDCGSVLIWIVVVGSKIGSY